jgi:hypothetical protein
MLERAVPYSTSSSWKTRETLERGRIPGWRVEGGGFRGQRPGWRVKGDGSLGRQRGGHSWRCTPPPDLSPLSLPHLDLPIHLWHGWGEDLLHLLLALVAVPEEGVERENIERRFTTGSVGKGLRIAPD